MYRNWHIIKNKVSHSVPDQPHQTAYKYLNKIYIFLNSVWRFWTPLPAEGERNHRQGWRWEREMDVTSLEQLLSAFPVELCKTGNIISLADPKNKTKNNNQQTNQLFCSIKMEGGRRAGVFRSNQFGSVSLTSSSLISWKFECIDLSIPF